MVDADNLLKYINPHDLRSYGLIPELIGRLPVLTYLEPLSEETLKLILTKPKNALVKQYQKLMEFEGIQLEIDDEAIDYIVDKAVEFKLGARGLRSICEAIMTDAMFEAPSSDDLETLVISKEYAAERLTKSRIQKLKAA